MKRMLAALLAAVLLYPFALRSAQAAGPETAAASAILVDAASGRVLYEKNAREKRLIASITKLMTALVAVESTPDLEDEVTIQPADTLAEGSSMYLKPGEKLPLKTLLYGLLLQSGNDAALAVARHCAGDVETFVDWMNQRAVSLGMEDTHFANPNGLNDEAHYSTAADMAVLAAEVLRHEARAEFVGSKSITLGARTFTNHNKLLWQYEGCEGMKTGYTQLAGRTLVSCARREGQLLICVTLSDPDDWKDHAALFDYGFETYPRQVLATAGKVFRRVPVEGSLTRFVAVRTGEDVYYPTAAEEELQAELLLPERAQAPVTEGTIAGKLSFYLGETCVGETYLLYDTDVRRDAVVGSSLLRRVLDFLNRADSAAFLTAFAPHTS